MGWALLIVLAVAGCGKKAEPGSPAPQKAGFDAAAATVVLTAFDQADSAATSAGNVEALASQETGAALEASVASAHRTKAQGRTQPQFQHTKPVFAIPAAEQPDCFLTVATLALPGEELQRTDLSQFSRQPAGGWKLSLHVLVAPEAEAAVRTIGGQPASTADAAIPAPRREAIAAEVFGRSVATKGADNSTVASSAILDNQLAAGWGIYQQQMNGAKIDVSRHLDGTEWSACAVKTAAGTVAFLTLRVTDNIAPQPGGPAKATLVPQSPDLMATGHTTPVQGASIAVARVEMFALLVPDAGAASVLGATDAAIAVTTKG
jgi:hypothetical protein